MQLKTKTYLEVATTVFRMATPLRPTVARAAPRFFSLLRPLLLHGVLIIVTAAAATIPCILEIAQRQLALQGDATPYGGLVHERQRPVKAVRLSRIPRIRLERSN